MGWNCSDEIDNHRGIGDFKQSFLFHLLVEKRRQQQPFVDRKGTQQGNKMSLQYYGLPSVVLVLSLSVFSTKIRSIRQGNTNVRSLFVYLSTVNMQPLRLSLSWLAGQLAGTHCDWLSSNISSCRALAFDKQCHGVAVFLSFGLLVGCPQIFLFDEQILVDSKYRIIIIK
jgi:hypothetical protein